MKKIALFLISVFIYSGLMAQVDKTQLSIDVSKRHTENYKNLSQYTWKRNVDGFSEGKKVTTSLSSVQFSADGKITATIIQQQSFVEKKPGLRGAAQKGQMDDMSEYVKNAVELAMKYIYLTTGQMVDFFNKGTLSVSDGNILQAEAFNFLTQGDHLNYKYDKTSLNYISQDISTVMNGDPVKALVTYETVNGMTRVSKVELTLPAVKINATLTNIEYAKKL